MLPTRILVRRLPCVPTQNAGTGTLVHPVPAGATWPLALALVALARRENVIRRIGQKRDIARSLDRSCQYALVLGAVACLTTGTDLASIRDTVSQDISLLVADDCISISDASRTAIC